MIKLLKFFFYVFLGFFSLFYCAYLNRSKVLYSCLDEGTRKKLAIYGDISSKICEKYNISGGQTGSGYNFEEKKTESLYFMFDLKKKLDVEKARELLVPIFLECLKAINTRSELSSYLFPHPFGIINIDISISFSNKYGYKTELNPYVSCICAFNGGIEYLSYTGRGDYYKEPSYREDFATAYSLTKHQLSKDLQEVAEKAMRSDVRIPNIAASHNKYLREHYPPFT